MSAANKNRCRIIPQNLITAASKGAYFDSRNEFKSRKRHAITAAKELGYGGEVLAKLKEATTDGEIERIMRSARHNQK